MGTSYQRDDGDMNPGYLEMTGGWCVPLDQVFEGWGPLTAPRGIIHPPTKKETPMTLTHNQALRKAERQLDAVLIRKRNIERAEAELRDKIRSLDLPAAPPKNAGDMFLVEVMFADSGRIFEYLLKRVGDRWFTTGTKDDQKVFGSWLELCQWLNSTQWHSNLSMLTIREPRLYPTQWTQEPPF